MAKKGNVQKAKNAVKQINKIAKALGHADLGGSVGRKVGGKIGQKLGSKAAGQRIGQFIGSAMGKGDYVVSSNALGRSSQNLGAQVPSFSGNQEATIIEHREYIGDLISAPTTNTFQVLKYVFNPSNYALFPWLSTIAGNYEQYEPLGAIVTFKSTSADFNASGQSLGTVIIASDYDVYDAVYANKVEMENSTFAVSCKTAESMLHPIECDPKLRATRLLYNGPSQTVGDKRFHDLCNIQVATQGISGTSVNLGELWITYRIKLHKPQLNPESELNMVVQYGSCNNAANPFWGGIITLDNRLTNTLAPYVLFKTPVVGSAQIEFTNPTTWQRTFNITFAITNTATAASALTITPTPVDAQVAIIVSQPLFVSAITVANTYSVQALIIVKRNELLAQLPAINFVFNYTAADFVGPTSVCITEMNDRAYNFVP